MSKNYYFGAAKTQASDMTNYCVKIIQGMKESIKSIEDFNNDMLLQGKTYNSAKKYVKQTYYPVAKGTIAACEEIIRHCKNYPRKFSSDVANTDVIEDHVRDQINEVKSQRRKIEEVNDKLPVRMLDNPINGLNAIENKLNDKISDLYAYDSSTQGIFDNAESILLKVQSGLGQIKKHGKFNSKTGTFSTEGMELGTLKLLESLYDNRDFMNKYNVPRPKGMTDGQFAEYIGKLSVQAKELKRDGWDDAAVQGYLKYVDTSVKGLSPADVNKHLDEIGKERFAIGSGAYVAMFKSTKMSSKEKLELVFKQLHAKFDDNNFLQLSGKYHLDPNMPPHGEFLKLFRECVLDTFKDERMTLLDYSTKGGRIGRLADKVNGFRVYIDKNNIDYIRNRYTGKNDYEKLLKYEAEFDEVKLNYSIDANYHNRYYDKFGYPKNMKISVGGNMSEFIVDIKSGNIASAWNMLVRNKKGQIVVPKNLTKSQKKKLGGLFANTESFNYGKPRGNNPALKNDTSHNRLDVKHPKDSTYRENATKDWKWETSFDKGGKYADIVKEGGRKDVETWNNKVDEKRRQEAYDDFVSYCRRNDSNLGFSDFLNETGKSYK